MSLEQKIEKLTEALAKNNELLTAVVAGQKAAMTKLTEASTVTTTSNKAANTADNTTSTRRGRPPKVETPAKESKTTSSVEFTNEMLKEATLPWMTAAKGDEKAAIKDFLKALTTEFGVTKVTEIADQDELKRALFYVARRKEGLEVDFNAEYDFDGEPTQDVGGSEAEDDMF